MARYDPTKRLPIDAEENYAQERAFGYRLREAARRAGLNPNNGIATKYEAKPRIQARIAYLRRDDLTIEMREAKRRHLEERLELAAFGSIFEVTKMVFDSPQIDWPKLAESDLGVIISEFHFDKDTGRLVRFKRDDALGAIAQLRDMRGFKAAEKHDVTVRDAQMLSDDELARIATRGSPGAIEAPVNP